MGEKLGSPHTWRTRPDPLEEIWPQALEMLREAPELEARALFEHLRAKRPEEIGAGLLRTFQRRVRRWRLMEGEEKEVYFTQDHKPAEELAGHGQPEDHDPVVSTGLHLAVLSMFGFVALAGVAVNESLVLVDFINRAVRSGTPVWDAVCQAGVQRFRPILLTSLTTFAGLTPLILEKSVQAQFLIPMTVSLGFGVIYCTFTTLLLIPAQYVILEDLKRIGGRMLGRPATKVDQRGTSGAILAAKG